MITVVDIYQHLEQALISYPDGREATVLELLLSGRADLQVCLTSDVEESELHYLDRIGPGESFYFRVRDKKRGLLLAFELLEHLGLPSTLADHCGEEDGIDRQLYLLVHVSLGELTENHSKALEIFCGVEK